MYREEDEELAKRLIDAIIKAVEELGHAATVSGEYRNRREPGKRVYIRVY